MTRHQVLHNLISYMHVFNKNSNMIRVFVNLDNVQNYRC